MVSEQLVLSLEKDYNEFEESHKWPFIYHEIRAESAQVEYTCKDAKRLENRVLNRYRDVSPYDQTRVRLQRGSVDYINASLVEVAAAGRRYVLAQGPLPNTTGHFWLLVWEQLCRAVIMLNRTIEKNQIKCHQYWPLGGATEQQRLQLDDVNLSVELISQTDCGYYTVSTLRLSDTASGESREVLHFHYTTWPDFGIPQSPRAFLQFLWAVRQAGALEPEVGPAVVHCSAGVGRSGTFCLVDSYLLMLERGCTDGLSVRDVLLSMRRYRMGLIQTHEQLKFSYQAIVQGARTLLEHGSLCDMTNGGGSPLKRLRANDSESDSDSIPPPPPPRTDSLRRSRQSTSVESEPDNLTEPATATARQEATAPAAAAAEDTAAEPQPDQDADVNQLVDAPTLSQEDGGLRQRRARKAELARRVQQTRHKQQQHELWQRRRRQLRPLGYAAGALATVAILYMAYTRLW